MQISNDQKEVMEDVVLDKVLGNIGYHILRGIWELGIVLFGTMGLPYSTVNEEDI